MDKTSFASLSVIDKMTRYPDSGSARNIEDKWRSIKETMTGAAEEKNLGRRERKRKNGFKPSNCIEEAATGQQ
ncbi:hypothetical protein QYM36_001465 [Artemia franciscana]|uniref:Uncharacterized protein n=1 Tax=Artemia franciscana TaxID=6661 RepID=A0AA88I6G4_ARTSF|nr:hypothetical protein QYM36_001465 [Artemia franciscana]